MSAHFPPDVQFERDTVRFRENNRLLVIKNIGYKVSCADFKQACRERLTEPGAPQPPAMHFFWQAADRNTSSNLHRDRVEVGFDHREPFLRAEKELRDWKFQGRKVQVERASRRRWAHKLLEGGLAGSAPVSPPPPPPPPPPAGYPSGSAAGFPASSVSGVPSAAAARAAAVKTTAAAVRTTASAAAACAEALAAAQAKYDAAAAAADAVAAYAAAVDAAAADTDADAAAAAPAARPPAASTSVQEDFKVDSNADIADAAITPALQRMGIVETQEPEEEDWPDYCWLEDV